MNKYYFTFVFKGNFEFATFTANQLANSVLGRTDDILDFVCDEEEVEPSIFSSEFRASDDENYSASWEEPTKLSIYDSDANGGCLIEKNVPWILLKVVNKEGKVIYNLSDNV